MARQERIVLAIPDGVATGVPQVVDRHTGKTIFFTTDSIGGGTLRVFGSLDGATFAQVGSDVTAAGFVIVEETLNRIRIDRTAGSSSGESVDLLAFDERAF